MHFWQRSNKWWINAALNPQQHFKTENGTNAEEGTLHNVAYNHNWYSHKDMANTKERFIWCQHKPTPRNKWTGKQKGIIAWKRCNLAINGCAVCKVQSASPTLTYLSVLQLLREVVQKIVFFFGFFLGENTKSRVYVFVALWRIWLSIFYMFAKNNY